MLPITRRRFIHTGLTVAGTTTLSCSSRRAPVRPNILLITTDQHNAEIIGCAGNPVVKTPNLDRLAARGMLFQEAYCPHPLCTPARTTIFTGQYRGHHGVPMNINTSPGPPKIPYKLLGEDAVAFPEVLARNGYETSLFGKKHTEQHGTKNFGLQVERLAEGKGHFINYGEPPDDYRQYLQNNGYTDAAWQIWLDPEYVRRGWGKSRLPVVDYIDTWTVTEAMKYIDTVRKPFFSWVSLSGPHTPWDPPEHYAEMYDPADIPMPHRRPGELEDKHERWTGSVAATITALPSGSQDSSLPRTIEAAYRRWPEERIRPMLAAYYGQVTLIDDQVGRLLDCLEARGLRDNTLILFTADHGEHLGNNWGMYKNGVHYDSLARIPWIVNWPGYCREGAVCRELVSLADIAPAFLAAAGLQPVDPVDGRSFLPLLTDPSVTLHNDLYLDSPAMLGIVSKEWKYLRYRADGFEELYNHGNDPRDLYNLATQPEQAELCRALSQRLNAMVEQYG